jgi:CRP-like cAMP-binding protein
VSTAELAKFALLAPLAEAEREALLDELELLEPVAGSALFRAGDPADGALFVAEGRVRVHAPWLGGDAEFAAGEVLGTLSLVVEGPRETTAETLSRARIWRLGRSAYRRLVAAEPATACRLLEGILREYAGAVRRAVGGREPTAAERGAVDPVRSSD